MGKFIINYYEKRYNRNGKQVKSMEVCYTTKAESKEAAETNFLYKLATGEIDNFDDTKQITVDVLY